MINESYPFGDDEVLARTLGHPVAMFTIFMVGASLLIRGEVITDNPRPLDTCLGNFDLDVESSKGKTVTVVDLDAEMWVHYLGTPSKCKRPTPPSGIHRYVTVIYDGVCNIPASVKTGAKAPVGSFNSDGHLEGDCKVERSLVNKYRTNSDGEVVPVAGLDGISPQPLVTVFAISTGLLANQLV